MNRTAFDPGPDGLPPLPNPYASGREVNPEWEALYDERPDTVYPLGQDILLFQTTRPHHGIDVIVRPPSWPLAAAFRVKVYAKVGDLGGFVAVDQQRIPGNPAGNDVVCSVRQYAERFQVWAKLENAVTLVPNDPTVRVSALAGPFVGERPDNFNVAPWMGQGNVGAVQDIGGATGIPLFAPSAVGNDDRIEIYGFDAFNVAGATRWVQLWASIAAAPAAALFRGSWQVNAGQAISIRLPAPIVIRGTDATIRASSTGPTYTAVAGGEVFSTTFVRR